MAVRGKPDQARYRALRTQAVELLISAQWLVGEAADRGLRISAGEARQLIAARKATSFPGGEGEFREFLKTTGETLSDLELQARAELASTKLRRLAAAGARTVTAAQVAAYYTRHRQLFFIPQRRDVRITNRKSAAAAEQLEREVEAGKSFAALSEPESVARTSISAAGDILDRAIYAAKLHVLTGPVRQRVDYFVFVVEDVIPARYLTLDQVSGSIRSQLLAERQRRAVAVFIEAWKTAWIASTSCLPGYVVQKCREYDGPRAPEEPFELSS